VEGPWEEEDLCGRAFGFCGADDGGDGFEVVLEVHCQKRKGEERL
jgi:hypothetical protein